MAYQIEKGLPMPVPQKKKREHCMLDGLRSLEPGDSILISDRTQGSVYSSISKISTVEKQFTSKKTPDGIRVWRVM